jgi:hypothetical protein
MKNFSNTKMVFINTILALDRPYGMIDYTFLLHGKNDLGKARSSGTEIH